MTFSHVQDRCNFCLQTLTLLATVTPSRYMFTCRTEPACHALRVPLRWLCLENLPLTRGEGLSPGPISTSRGSSRSLGKSCTMLRTMGRLGLSSICSGTVPAEFTEMITIIISTVGSFECVALGENLAPGSFPSHGAA